MAAVAQNRSEQPNHRRGDDAHRGAADELLLRGRMLMSGLPRQAAEDEGGAVVVFFALFAPGAVLLLSFVIDSGAWFDHARHLQLQADAAALAAAEGFQP